MKVLITNSPNIPFKVLFHLVVKFSALGSTMVGPADVKWQEIK